MFDTKALAGQIGRNLLDRLQTMGKPFCDLPEASQQALIDGCMADGKALVQGAFAAILEKGDTELDITIHDVRTKKESVQAVVSCPRDHEFAGKLPRNAHMPAKLHFLNIDRDEAMALGDAPKASPNQSPMFSDKPTSAPVKESTAPKKRRGRPPKASPTNGKKAPAATRQRVRQVKPAEDDFGLATE